MVNKNKQGSAKDQRSQTAGTQVPESFRRLFHYVAKYEGTDQTTDYKPFEMMMKVTTRPNPFFTSVTLDVTSDQNRHIIVRMFDEAGKIIKMLSWYVMKGSNVTSINELNVLTTGQYFLDIIDSEGTVLFNTILNKE